MNATDRLRRHTRALPYPARLHHLPSLGLSSPRSVLAVFFEPLMNAGDRLWRHTRVLPYPARLHHFPQLGLSSPRSVLAVFSGPPMTPADSNPRVCSLRKTVQRVPAAQQQPAAHSDRAGIEVSLQVAGGDHVKRRFVLQYHRCAFTTSDVDMTAGGQW